MKTNKKFLCERCALEACERGANVHYGEAPFCCQNMSCQKPSVYYIMIATPKPIHVKS